MGALRAVFYLLFVLAAAAALLLVALFFEGLGNGAVSADMVPLCLVPLAIAGAILFGGWRLGRRGRLGSACLLLLLGPLALFFGAVVLLMPGSHH